MPFFIMKTLSKLVILTAIVNIGFIIAYIIKENLNLFFVFMFVNLILLIVCYVIIIQSQHKKNYMQIMEDLVNAGNMIKKPQTTKDAAISILYMIKSDIYDIVYPPSNNL